jgi:hypothetical protein
VADQAGAGLAFTEASFDLHLSGIHGEAGRGGSGHGVFLSESFV